MRKQLERLGRTIDTGPEGPEAGRLAAQRNSTSVPTYVHMPLSTPKEERE